MRDMLKLNLCVAVAASLLLAACGTTRPTGAGTKEPVKDTVDKDKDKPEPEDLTTIHHVQEVEAPEYVKGIKEEAQDAFRHGVVLVHQVPPKYQEAIDEFEKAIELEPTFLEPYFNIAMVHERQRRPQEALKTYQRALKANPDSPDAQAFIGKIYLANARDAANLGKNVEAERLMSKGKALFDEVLARDYENVPANNALALYWLLKGDVAKAEEYVKQVLTVDTENVTALNTRGLIFLKQNELDFAKWIFAQKVLILDPNSIEAHTNLGAVYVLLKELPKAVMHFKRAVSLDPSNTAARMDLGAIYIDFLNYPAAKEEFSKVLEIQPENVEAMIGMGSATLGLGDMTKAIAMYEAALKLDKRRNILLFRIGSLIEKHEGGTEAGLKRAIGYYERYIAAAHLPPEHELVKKIPVLKEVISSGMLRQPPEGADDGTGAEAKPKEAGTPDGTAKPAAPVPDKPGTEEAPKAPAETPKAEAPKTEPAKTEPAKAGDKAAPSAPVATESGATAEPKPATGEPAEKKPEDKGDTSQ